MKDNGLRKYESRGTFIEKRGAAVQQLLILPNAG
jgi:hypothetical protein